MHLTPQFQQHWALQQEILEALLQILEQRPHTRWQGVTMPHLEGWGRLSGTSGYTSTVRYVSEQYCTIKTKNLSLFDLISHFSVRQWHQQLSMLLLQQ